jgi:hypothetical protein
MSRSVGLETSWVETSWALGIWNSWVVCQLGQLMQTMDELEWLTCSRRIEKAERGEASIYHDTRYATFPLEDRRRRLRDSWVRLYPAAPPFTIYVPLVYSWTTRHSPTVPSTEWIPLYTSRVVLMGGVYFRVELDVVVVASRGFDHVFRPAGYSTQLIGAAGHITPFGNYQ